jgi:hypothetical protein
MSETTSAALLEEDVRRRAPDWKDLAHLVEAARKLGWTEQQLEFLSACIGITWAKAHHAGEMKARREGGGR